MNRRLIGFTLVAALALVAAPPASGQTTAVELQPFLKGLDFPSNMAFAPDGRLFFNEKDTGDIRIVRDGELLPDPFFHLDVVSGGETGLLGVALDPNFDTDPWVYVYYTSADDNHNKVQRIRADGDRGTDVEDVITLLEQHGIHNGGDITFGPDGKLYVVTGETGDADLSQNLDSLGGKVLRLNPDGSIPDDNPFGDSPVYSYGHRNSFGLCFNPKNGDLWETENGPDRYDEINRIEAGKNYGWPIQLGPEGAPDFVEPQLAFSAVIVITGCAFTGDVMFFGDFHQELHAAALQGPGQHRLGQDEVVARLSAGITDLEIGPDGMLYVSTATSIVRADVGALPTPSFNPSSPSGGSGDGGGIDPVAVVLVGIGLGALVWIGVVSGRRLRRRVS